jgi:hypothetical protein
MVGEVRVGVRVLLVGPILLLELAAPSRLGLGMGRVLALILAVSVSWHCVFERGLMRGNAIESLSNQSDDSKLKRSNKRNIRRTNRRTQGKRVV